MNKISKKIVALATMAAFVLTLVPAAAFAADETAAVDPRNSSVQTVEKDVEVYPGEAVAYQLNLMDKDENAIADQAAGNSADVYVWAVDAEGNIVRDVDFYSDNAGKTPVSDSDMIWLNNAPVVKAASSWNTRVMSASFDEAGSYTIMAGVMKNGETTLDEIEDLAAFSAGPKGYTTIEVTDRAIGSIAIWDDQNKKGVEWNDNNVGELDLTKYPGFDANGTDRYTVTGWVNDENGNHLAGRDVQLTSERPDILALYGEAADGVVTSDKDGEFTFQFTMNDNRNVPITISAGDVTYTLRILKESVKTYDIDTTLDDGYVLAGNDTKNWTGDARVFTDAVQFSVTDIKGDAITGKLDSEPATNEADKDHTRYLDLISKPEKSDLTASKLALYWDENAGVYTLKYVGKDGEQVKDLIPGEYTVKVALTSGDYTEATFNVAKFGTVQDIVLDMYAKDQTTNRVIAIDDEVTLGQNVAVFAKYVDENGLKIVANDGIDFGAYGKAVTDVNYGWDKRSFSTKADIASNESLLGTTITVTAYSLKNKAYVEQELTVVDSYNAFTLEFDPAEGPVNEDNDVTVKVVKEDGSVAKVDGELQAYVADQSNEDAVVSVEKVKDVDNGKGVLRVYASQPTTVDIVVAVKDSSNQGLYAATLEYTVGNVDITAHHNVVMTIGSSEYVVDKQLFTMDAAPYVDSNWRTMVPIRALAEAFDATVTYDNDARTVTIEYNEQTIVMTIDSATYTVNGVEGEMDTEAVINSADDRTYVPIRFAAEAMGFTVTALYDENSSTASVVFQS